MVSLGDFHFSFSMPFLHAILFVAVMDHYVMTSNDSHLHASMPLCM